MLRPVLFHPAVVMDCRKMLALTIYYFLPYCEPGNSVPALF